LVNGSQMEGTVRLETLKEQVAVQRIEELSQQVGVGRVQVPHDPKPEERGHDRQPQTALLTQEVLHGRQYAVARATLLRGRKLVWQAAALGPRHPREQPPTLHCLLTELVWNPLRIVVVIAP